MSELFKSAISYFNNGITSSESNDYVNQIVEVNGLKLHIKRVIAEGGFAFVYVAQDTITGNEYALKRLFGADKEACNNIIKEINIHKQLSGHPNVVKFMSASFVDRTKSAQGTAEYLLVTELCKGGALTDCLENPLEPDTVLQVIYQASKAIAHMHSQNTAITHRDIKLENFLIGSDGLIKLCDFGSATTDVFVPDNNWSAGDRNDLEDKLAAFTTPMYRAPEQLDTWQNFPIGPKSDVWALGCILYCLCYQKHPFEDSAKLRIINGNFTIPSSAKYSCFSETIKGCLIVDPDKRYDVSTVLERLASISETKGWSLKGFPKLTGKPLNTPPSGSPISGPSYKSNDVLNGQQPKVQVIMADEQPQVVQQHKPHPPRPAEPPKVHNTNPALQTHQLHQQNNPVPSGGLFSSLKGGAGSFLKNLKDTSSKVMQTVQQTMTKTDMDITYITSRIIIMPCPSEGLESTYKTNNIEDVKLYLESRHLPAKISIYNLGPRTTPRLPPPIRTVEASSIYFPFSAKAPLLQAMYSLAEDMHGFLNSDPKNVIVVQGTGAAAATMVSSLLIYGNLITQPEDAIQIFAVKRSPPNIKPSELRYLYYLGDIVRSKPHLPHNKSLTLLSMSVSPVPRMTKARDGCRLFVEIVCNDKIILNTIQDYEKMKLYSAGDGKITLPLNLNVCGDLTVTLFHARNGLGGMRGPQGLKVCQLQIHSGFIPEQETLLNFDKSELDDLPDAEHIPNSFNIAISISVGDEIPLSKIPPWQPAKAERNPLTLFGSDLEFAENLDNFVTKPIAKKPPPPRPAPPPPIHKEEPIQMPAFEANFPDQSQIPAQEKENNDLLNLNQNQNNPQLETNASFDLLGDFGASSEVENSQPDVVTSSTGQTNFLDDMFGAFKSSFAPKPAVSDLNGLNLDFNTPSQTQNSNETTADPFENLLGGSVPLQPKSSNIPEKATVPPPTTTSNDPFGDFGNLASKLNIGGWGGNLFGAKPTPAPTSQTQTPQFASPVHQPSPQPTVTNLHPSTAPTSSQTTPTHQMKSPGDPTMRPDYARANFDQTKNNTGGSVPTGGAAAAAGPGGDIFADILGSQGYNFASKQPPGPRTINAMRKEEVAQTMDPERFKIMEWTEGKKGNIRALMCSMHTVLWEGGKWNKCEMHQLVSVADVKKAYRKACLAVHPDKHVATENEELSKLIFIELNNAWSEFENDSKQQNVFSS